MELGKKLIAQGAGSQSMWRLSSRGPVGLNMDFMSSGDREAQAAPGVATAVHSCMWDSCWLHAQ
jgi:hypothetical protein